MTVDFNASGKPLPHLWSACVGAGRAAEGLRAAWQEQLAETVRECGFRYIRFHGLLAEDMFVYAERDGRPCYNWYCIDELFDRLLSIGIRPVVELGFMPPALASGTATQFWWRANVTPPENFGKWGALIRNLVLHWKERYGLEEIRKWYYEVWNEPDLNAFWAGTRSQYFELYRTTVQAVKSVDQSLPVGGPATSNFVPDGRFEGETEDTAKQVTNFTEDIDSLPWRGVWIREFLDYCEKENLPVDFVSTHPYPTDFALDGQQRMKGRTRSADSLKQDLTWLNRVVRESAYPNAKILLTEWSSSPTSRDCSHDTLPAADYIVKCCLDCADLADCLSYWVFTDIFEEAGGGPEAFHGGFGLMTMHGIKKPAYHAFRMLNALGDTEIARENEGIVTKDSGGKLSALFYNYGKTLRQAIPISEYPDRSTAKKVMAMGEPREEHLVITGMKPGALVRIERMDEAHTAAFVWEQMGCPANLTKEQERVLKEIGPELSFIRSDDSGRLRLDLTLAPWEIVLVQETD